MVGLIRLLVLAIFMFVFTLQQFAQFIDMQFIDILDKKQLTSSFASCIAQDNKGFIWVGTTDGLNRFDGYEVKQYKNIEDDTTSIQNNNILDIFCDPDNNLWIITGTGICLYQSEQDNFKTLASGNNYAGLSGFPASKVKTGFDKRVYISVNEYLYFFNEDKNLFELYYKINNGIITNFIFDEDSSIWIGARSNGGVYHISKEKKVLTHFDAISKSNPLSNAEIMDIEQRGDEIWIATNGGGYNVINKNNGKVVHLPVPWDFTQYATDVFIDNNNRVWTIDITGLKLYDDHQHIFYAYYSDERDKTSVKPFIGDIFQDKQGNYWTLHSPYGVGLRIPPRGFQYFNKDKNSMWQTTQNNISAISEDSLRNLWLGNSSNGIDVFLWDKGKIKTYTTESNNPYSLGEGSVFKIYQDSRGRMWVGTYMGGLQYFDPKTEKFFSYKHDPENSNSIVGNDIRDIEEDSDGNLWIVVHGKGIDKFDRQTGIFHHFNKSKNGLSNDWAFDILFDKDSALWVASAWGVSKLPANGQTFQVFEHQQKNEKSLSSSEVVCLHQDKLNNLWIGTANGLNKYVGSGIFERVKSNYVSNHIQGILSDDDNNLWVSTSTGLRMYNPKSNKWFGFDSEDGLTSEEYYANVVFDNGKNGLFFGGVQGVDIVPADQIYFNTDTPKVVITDFKLFYESVNDFSSIAQGKQNISFIDKITLKYKQNVIGFKFAALNYYQTSKNNYAYIMEGFDNEWVYCGTKREVVYTNLDPGKYTFKVKASNNDGVWNEEGTSIDLVIIPPWWKTWLFRLFIIFFFIFAVSGIYFLRIIQLQKQKKMLADMVDEKTDELHRKNEVLLQQADDLNDVNTLLEERQQYIEEQSEELKAQAENREKLIDELQRINLTKDKMFSIISHDLRSPFNSIIGFSDILSSSFDDLSRDNKKEMIDTVNRSSRKVYVLLENLLKWARTQTGDIAFLPEKYKVTDLFSDVEHLIDSSLIQKGITLSKNIDPNYEVFVDIDMIYTVLRNLLSNAIKFTKEGGTIKIEGKKKKSYYEIEITDSGVGMPEKIIKTLFLIDDAKVRAGTDGEKGSGLGLVLCREFVNRNNGEISVESKVGQGTVFRFTLPLFIG